MANVWFPSCNRYVAFLDIMGYKDFVLRNDHEAVKQRAHWIKNTVASIQDHLNNLKFVGNYKPIKTAIFSDSILIVSEDDSEESLWSTISASMMLLSECFTKSPDPIPIKGAISKGEMLAQFKDNLFAGQPLIDAYLLQEDLWIYGVVLDNTAEAALSKSKVSMAGEEALQAPIPLKSGTIHHYIGNWMYHATQVHYTQKTKNAYEPIQKEIREYSSQLMRQFYSQMSGRPRRYVDNTIETIEKLF